MVQFWHLRDRVGCAHPSLAEFDGVRCATHVHTRRVATSRRRCIVPSLFLSVSGRALRLVCNCHDAAGNFVLLGLIPGGEEEAHG
eukprot:2753695-Prymnesium_polylepis.1